MCGSMPVYKRILKTFQKKYPEKNFKVCFLTRNLVFDVLKDKNYYKETEKIKIEEDVLFINSRLLYSNELAEQNFTEEFSFFIENNLSGFFIKSENARKKGFYINPVAYNGFNDKQKDFILSLDKKNISGKIVNYLWDLVNAMPEVMALDFSSLNVSGKRKPESKGKFHKTSVIYGDENLFFCNINSEIYPHAVIDTKNGPVIIDESAEIHPFSRIEGPTYIGKSAIVLGAKIRSGTFIGEKCRVGGEIENSIIHGNSNKYHDGFLGHSYIGEWVNLGALTTNSDLKNNYSEVSVQIEGKTTHTGISKVGCFIGDHSKTSIGCLFNTGTYIGVMANVLATSGLLPKYIPSFSNYMNGKFARSFPLSSLFETANIVKARRNEKFTEAETKLFTTIYKNSETERKKLTVRR